MARKIIIAALFVVLAATLLQSTYATTYTVGDSTGWQIPTGNSELYDNWADNKNFVVGDILVFTFTTGEQDVAEVTEVAYDACTATNTIFTENNGPARIRLKRTGDHYFICTVPGHCAAGQKLRVEVLNGTTTVPTHGSNIPGVLTPNPPSLASSLVATLSVVFMSIALVLVC
ncbi:hypothetical protein REPUB_Repub18cG0075800 [Reevesia pubescens]